MAARGYFHMRLPNGKICLKRSLWYVTGASVHAPIQRNIT